MKAIVYREYGPPDVVRLDDVETPTPGDSDILIQIHAAVVTTPDVAFRKGVPFMARTATGLMKPKKHILGSELAGRVHAVGSDVSRFKAGDRVVAASATDFGAHAEYISLPDDGAVAPLPDDLTYEDAVAITEGALTALPFLRDKAGIRGGQRVLINGASGSVGSSAVQLAKHFGAEVTAVTSGANAELVLSLGADHVIDYTQEDYTQNGQTYDIVFDAVGKNSFSRSKKVLAEGGVYLTTVPSVAIVIHSLTSRFGSKKAVFSATGLRSASDKTRDLLLVEELIEDGTLVPVIDRRYPLEEADTAHAYVETGHKKGVVVLTVRASD